MNQTNTLEERVSKYVKAHDYEALSILASPLPVRSLSVLAAGDILYLSASNEILDDLMLLPIISIEQPYLLFPDVFSIISIVKPEDFFLPDMYSVIWTERDNRLKTECEVKIIISDDEFKHHGWGMFPISKLRSAQAANQAEEGP
jgi:hypothetical protein